MVKVNKKIIIITYFSVNIRKIVYIFKPNYVIKIKHALVINFNNFKIRQYRTKKYIFNKSSFEKMIKDYFTNFIKKHGYCNEIYDSGMVSKW